MLVKSYQWETAGSKTFADTAKHWARDYIAVAYARQIAKGYNDTRFGPDDYITREQMAVMLAQAAELRNVTGTRTFSDQERISPWAREAVAAASSKGIINGYPDKSFKPKMGFPGSAIVPEAGALGEFSHIIVVAEITQRYKAFAL